MGYYMNLVEANWKISDEYARGIINDLKQFASTSTLAWINSRAVEESETFGEVMDELRYTVEWFPETEEWSIEDFNGEKLGDDEELFKIIAKYSPAGSFVKFNGEDNYSWYWTVSDTHELVEEGIHWSDYDWREETFIEKEVVNKDEENIEYRVEIGITTLLPPEGDIVWEYPIDTFPQYKTVVCYAFAELVSMIDFIKTIELNQILHFYAYDITTDEIIEIA